MKKTTVLFLMVSLLFCGNAAEAAVPSMALMIEKALESGGTAYGVCTTDKYAFVREEKRVSIYNIEDLNNITYLTEIRKAISTDFMIVSKIQVKGDDLFVAFNKVNTTMGQPSCEVYDVSNITAGQTLTSWRTSNGYAYVMFDVLDDYFLVGNGYGLYLLKRTAPKTYTSSGCMNDLNYNKIGATVSNDASNIRFKDIRMEKNGGMLYAYVTTTNNKLYCVDMTIAMTRTETTDYSGCKRAVVELGNITSMIAKDNILYLSADSKLMVYDAETCMADKTGATPPTLLAEYDNIQANSMAVSGSYLLVSDINDGAVAMYSTDQPTDMELVMNTESAVLLGGGLSVSQNGDYVFVDNSTQGFSVYYFPSISFQGATFINSSGGELLQQGDMTYSADIVNYSNNTQTVYVILTCYDDGEICGMTGQHYDLTSGSNLIEQHITVQGRGSLMLRGMIVNSADDMKPVSIQRDQNQNIISAKTQMTGN